MDDSVLNTIICGDNTEVLATFAADSIPTVITDPPYGWSFMGKRWDYKVPSVAQFVAILRVLKPGGTMLCFAGSRTQHRMAVNVEDAGFILKDCIMWIYGSGFPKATDISKQIDKQAGPATSEAVLWEGWKSHGLKPAYEPILVAMKPNDGSYANNALTHGVAGLNIDAARIPFVSDADKKSAVFGRGTDILGGNYVGATHSTGETNIPPDDKGRFPANVIFDEQAAKMLDEQSGQLSQCGSPKNTTHKEGMFGAGTPGQIFHENDRGASRFFYCAKASRSERNEGCEQLEERAGGSMQANEGDEMDLGAASLSGEKIQRQPSKNHHPTVKPLALMEYLCKLTSTPTGGIVLDPFAGSGTTMLAAYNTGRDYIGIERDPDYVKIIEARLAGAKDKLGLFES